MLPQVMAVDQESGDAAFASVVVEVLAEGQLGMETLSCAVCGRFHLQADQRRLSLSLSTVVPYAALAEEHVISCTVGKALFLCTVFLTVLGCVVSMGMWLKKKHRGKRDPLERGCVAQGKHPNVVRS